MVSVSSIAFAVRSASQSTSSPIKLSLAQQLVAAALGYKSLAAFQASESNSSLMADAKHFILDLNLLSERVNQLNLSNSLTELESYIQSGIKQYLPKAQFHESLDSFLYDYVAPMVDDTVLNDEKTSSEMAITNGDGIDEVYVPIENFELDELTPIGQQLVLDLEGHVSMGIDTERPYSGHKIYVNASLMLERTGKNNFAEPICEVVDANLDTDWGYDEIEEHKISLSEALSYELGLELSEASSLIDANYSTNESKDGLIYNYIFDFTQYASPAVAAKIKAKHNSLIVEVPAWFFDNVIKE